MRCSCRGFSEDLYVSIPGMIRHGSAKVSFLGTTKQLPSLAKKFLHCRGLPNNTWRRLHSWVY